MSDPSTPVFIPDLRQGLQIPLKGIISRILQNDERSKVVLYGLAAGHEMTLHSAPVPATLYFLEGEATLTLGNENIAVGAGAFTYIPAQLEHAIAANSPVCMLLTIIK